MRRRVESKVQSRARSVPTGEEVLESEDPPPVEGTLVVDGAVRSVDWSVDEGTRMDVSTEVSTVWQLDPWHSSRVTMTSGTSWCSCSSGIS